MFYQPKIAGHMLRTFIGALAFAGISFSTVSNETGLDDVSLSFVRNHFKNKKKKNENFLEQTGREKMYL